MKYSKLLSIIIPVYNGEQYISQLVDSIVKHNDEPFYEIIIVDDGSTDNSFSVCQSLEQKYPSVRTFHKTNGGIASSRNFGLDKATGEFITFCDQDDIVINGYRPFIDKIIQSDADFLISNHRTYRKIRGGENCYTHKR